MQIKSIVAGAAIALIAGVGSVSAGEVTVDNMININTGTLKALPAGVVTPMSEAELDAVRGQGVSAGETYFINVASGASLLERIGGIMIWDVSDPS